MDRSSNIWALMRAWLRQLRQPGPPQNVYSLFGFCSLSDGPSAGAAYGGGTSQANRHIDTKQRRKNSAAHLLLSSGRLFLWWWVVEESGQASCATKADTDSVRINQKKPENGFVLHASVAVNDLWFMILHMQPQTYAHAYKCDGQRAGRRKGKETQSMCGERERLGPAGNLLAA